MTGSIDLATVWAFIIIRGLRLCGDGWFDLGLGILFPLFPQKADRDVIMNSVAPVWDGNEAGWCSVAAATIGRFPLAYAVPDAALYTPMIAMLMA
jgi:cytochrome d ubiquinol oxidase subunit II